jgi:hypothetical protein
MEDLYIMVEIQYDGLQVFCVVVKVITWLAYKDAKT